MSLIDAAIGLSRKLMNLQDSDYPPVIPFLCLLNCTRTSSVDDYDTKYEYDSEMMYQISDMVPLPVQAPVSLSFFQSLVQKNKLSTVELNVVHTDPKFDWRSVRPLSSKKERTGNEGTTVERFYHKAGILLINGSSRWQIATPSTTRHGLVENLQKAITDPAMEVPESIELAQCILNVLADHDGSHLPYFLVALSSLKQSAETSASANSDPSLVQAQVSRITDMMQKVLQTSSITFENEIAAANIHRFASSEGTEWAIPLITSAFARQLSHIARESYWHNKKDRIHHCVKFLLGFFVLSAPTSTSSTSRSELVDRLAFVVRTENAGLPVKWLHGVTSMCSALYADVLKVASEEFWSDVEIPVDFLTLVTMQLMCLTQMKKPLDDGVEDCLKTLKTLFASQQLESLISSGKISKNSFENSIIPAFAARLQLLTEWTRCDRDGIEMSNEVVTLRSVFEHITTFMHTYLADKIATWFPSGASWTFPIQKSASLFNQPSARLSYMSWMTHTDDVDVLCGCETCKLFKQFLQSPTESQFDFTTSKEKRSHVERAIKKLANPYLHHTTLMIPNKKNAQTLRVQKTQQLSALYEPQAKPLRDLLKKFVILQDDLSRSQQQSSSSSSSNQPTTPPINQAAAVRSSGEMPMSSTAIGANHLPLPSTQSTQALMHPLISSSSVPNDSHLTQQLVNQSVNQFNTQPINTSDKESISQHSQSIAGTINPSSSHFSHVTPLPVSSPSLSSEPQHAAAHLMSTPSALSGHKRSHEQI